MAEETDKENIVFISSSRLKPKVSHNMIIEQQYMLFQCRVVDCICDSKHKM